MSEKTFVFSAKKCTIFGEVANDVRRKAIHANAKALSRSRRTTKLLLNSTKMLKKELFRSQGVELTYKDIDQLLQNLAANSPGLMDCRLIENTGELPIRPLILLVCVALYEDIGGFFANFWPVWPYRRP